MERHIAVVGAVIVDDGLVLCAQRGPHGALAGLWEFPGGKIEPGEVPRGASNPPHRLSSPTGPDPQLAALIAETAPARQ
jgi:8-oxo-dGTP pyrophosphatase MutT (NUDIX family)